MKVINIKEFKKKFSHDSKLDVNQRIKSEATYMNTFSEIDEFHFAKFYDCFYDNQNYYIISELLDCNLQHPSFMETFDEMPLIEKLKWMLDMAKGVDTIHNFSKNKSNIKGDKKTYNSPLAVAHNDIKPENFMVSFKYGRFKIIDMGLVWPIGESMWAGTEIFMPPEKINNHNFKIQTSNDIWSLGITFGRLLHKDKQWPQKEFKEAKDNGKKIDNGFYKDLITKFKCSSFKIHQNNQDKYNETTIWNKFIEFISEKMLNVDVRSRVTIDKIVEKLNKFIDKLNNNQSSFSSNNKRQLSNNEHRLYPSIEDALELKFLTPDMKQHRNNDFEGRLEDPEKRIKMYII